MGFLLGALGTAFVIGGLFGLMLWVTWPQDSFDLDDYEYGWDELEDAEWAR